MSHYFTHCAKKWMSEKVNISGKMLEWLQKDYTNILFQCKAHSFLYGDKWSMESKARHPCYTTKSHRLRANKRQMSCRLKGIEKERYWNMNSKRWWKLLLISFHSECLFIITTLELFREVFSLDWCVCVWCWATVYAALLGVAKERTDERTSENNNRQ